MYMTIKETAEYLNMPVSTIQRLIQQRKIRTIHDGEQELIYQDQFNTHIKQMEKYKSLVEEYLSEPIPEDRDIKDED